MRGDWCCGAMLAFGLGACVRSSPAARVEGVAAVAGPSEGRGTPDHPAAAMLAWHPGPALPEPRTNNVVAALPGEAPPALFTLLGLGAGRTHHDVLGDGWMLPRHGADWAHLVGAPRRPGRLAATAQTLAGSVFVFGGYTVAPDGTEVSTPHVDVFDPASTQWSGAAPMPVPVDDAVSGVWKGQVVLVSGWHDRDNVRDVQVFDPATDHWSAGPGVIGTPVFGHAGGVVDDTVLYCDGVGVDRSRDPVFEAVRECYAMELSAPDPAWRAVPHHGRATRYRAAATGWPAHGWVVFAGGTARPYNYNGTGYDGQPAEPRAEVFAWDVATSAWITLPPLPVPSMDHRGLVVAGDSLWLVGGMLAGAEVSAAVWRLGPA